MGEFKELHEHDEWNPTEADLERMQMQDLLCRLERIEDSIGERIDRAH